MPFYEFICSDCKHSFTVRASFSEKKKALCPVCHSNNLKETYDGYGGGTKASSGAAAPAAPVSPFR